MRLYGKKFIKNSIAKATEARVETRDAIIWDIFPASHLARVKIQGSNTLIKAYYPLNWETTPVWLKPGNAVRIAHTGGVRNRIELVGHGTFVPTPVSGGSAPSPPTADDAILTGCRVQSLQENMTVTVGTGTFRIGGGNYSLTSSVDKTLDAAPGGGNYRYDLLVIGADKVVDYIKGAASPNPIVPSVPASHLECGRVLVYPGDTEILQTWVDRSWEPASIQGIYITPADSELSWSELTTDLQVGALDQYSNGIAPLTTYDFDIEFQSGNGDVGGVVPPNVYTKNTNQDHFHVTYTRDQLPTDASPFFKVTLTTGGKTFEAHCLITLLDVAGQPMYGGGGGAGTAQQGNVIVNCDGALTYNSVTGVLSWSGDIHIYFTTASSMACHNIIATSSITLNDNEFAYAALVEVNDQAISMAKAAIATGSESNFFDVLVMGYRNAASDRFYPVNLPNVEEAVVSLTSATAVTVYWNKGKVQKITLGHDVTFTFSGAKAGDKLIVTIKQNDAAAKTVTLPGDVRYGTDITSYAVTVTLDKKDKLGFIYDGDDSKYDLVAVSKGF